MKKIHIKEVTSVSSKKTTQGLYTAPRRPMTLSGERLPSRSRLVIGCCLKHATTEKEKQGSHVKAEMK